MMSLPRLPKWFDRPYNATSHMGKVITEVTTESNIELERSTSSPLDNRAHLMANTSQAPNLEGIRREMHGIAEKIRVMNEINARLVQHLAINNLPPTAPIPKDADRSRRSRRSSDYESQSQAKEFLPPFTVHQKDGKSLKDYIKRFNQVVLEVEDPPNDKVVVMAMMEGLCLGPLFDSLSKDVHETLSTLQSKADEYIVVEELVDAKQRRRGRDDHKRKEMDTWRAKYRDEVKSKRSDQDSRMRTNNRRPCMPPCQPDLMLPPFSTPIAQVLMEIKNEEFVKWLGGCSSSSRKSHARKASRRAEEEVYNLSTPMAGVHQPISFTNDNLRGLHFPHDDVLVISPIIANFNIQRILVDNGSSVDILFISAFDKMKISRDRPHPFHTPLVGFGGSAISPLGGSNCP
ncbi:hypothetical protein Acr_29g0001080 [Actinidia rufa]|uniref:Uncharacterized protein n=1 Tax=Actinidia rufa TaxID=165716 RepID=A0A7J0HCW8_9ERIC|nr:hypothetical protein Acr_29g0001080 [Actinidia rufa]